MKKSLFVLALLSMFSFVSAWQVDHFFVQIRPDTAVVNEAVDIIVKAVDAQWNVVKDFKSEWVVVEINWWNQEDYSIKNDMLEFKDSDQWQLTISKDLIFSKEWTYKLMLSDIMSDTLKWETSITVKWKWDWDDGAWWDIKVESPIEWSKEKSTSISVIAKTNMPNNSYEIYIDDEKKIEDLTSENWDISTTVDKLWSWNHVLIIKLLDVENKMVWQSKPVKFSIEWTESSDLFKSIEFVPSNTAVKWDIIKVIVKTSNNVSSAELDVKWMSSYPMDKSSEWEFTKDILAENVWTYSVSLNLTVDWSSKKFENVGSIIVTEWVAIKEVKYSKLNQWELNLEWTYEWDIKKFKVKYWVSQENMSNELMTTWAIAILTWINDIDTYYLMIYPIDDKDQEYWKSSELLVIEPNMKWAPSCIVKWITLSTMKDWDKHYLVWTGVAWVSKYFIYKSDNETKLISEMQKVWETTDTRFEYPFDAKAKKDIYNYYAVEAQCNDWNKVQVDKIKKVKVWPMDTIMFIALFSIMMYLSYKLYNYTKIE